MQTFTEYVKEASGSLEPEQPGRFERLRNHLQSSKWITNEQESYEVSIALHRSLVNVHNLLVSDSNADVNLKRLSYQNLLLSYHHLLGTSLLTDSKRS